MLFERSISLIIWVRNNVKITLTSPSDHALAGWRIQIDSWHTYSYLWYWSRPPEWPRAGSLAASGWRHCAPFARWRSTPRCSRWLWRWRWVGSSGTALLYTCANTHTRKWSLILSVCDNRSLYMYMYMHMFVCIHVHTTHMYMYVQRRATCRCAKHCLH